MRQQQEQPLLSARCSPRRSSSVKDLLRDSESRSPTDRAGLSNSHPSPPSLMYQRDRSLTVTSLAAAGVTTSGGEARARRLIDQRPVSSRQQADQGQTRRLATHISNAEHPTLSRTGGP